VGVLGVRYELSFRTWAVRSKPAATGMVLALLLYVEERGVTQRELAFFNIALIRL
jgi:hypothetical protein